MSDIKEAPGCLRQRAPRKSCSSGTAEHLRDTKSQAPAQDRQIVDLDTLDACIDAGLVYERELFRKQLRLRKFILNAIAYRDAAQDLSVALWKGAR